MYLVEAYFLDQATADKLKAVVRKPVMHSGHDRNGGSVGWDFKTRRAALGAFQRLCRVTTEYVYVVDYEAETSENPRPLASRPRQPH